MLIYILSLIGVSVFAVSGALAAGNKNYDWIGVFAIAFVTAVGGGTLRDLLLNRSAVFWVADPNYLWTVLISTVLILIYAKYFQPPFNLLLSADAFGLALFSISGAQIAEQYSSAGIVIVLMGVITGAVGGVIRDVLTQEAPLVFSPKENLYSSAAMIGIICYLFSKTLGVGGTTASLIGIAVILLVRFSAIIWQIRLPAFNPRKS